MGSFSRLFIHGLSCAIQNNHTVNYSFHKNNPGHYSLSPPTQPYVGIYFKEKHNNLLKGKLIFYLHYRYFIKNYMNNVGKIGKPENTMRKMEKVKKQ